MLDFRDCFYAPAPQLQSDQALVENRSCSCSHGEAIGLSSYEATHRARPEAEEALFEERERAQVTLDSIGDAVLGTDAHGRVYYMNVVAEMLTGFSRHEAIGRPVGEIFILVDAHTGEVTADPATRAMETDSIVAMEANALLISRDGIELSIEDSATPIHNRRGEIIGAVIVFRDARFSREATARMAFLAQHDSLTGLANRNAFADRFEQALALAKRHRKQMSLLFIDIDNFKDINDALGHESGDLVLTAVASKLLSCVRITDTVARFGGDEFVILLSEIDQPEQSFAVAKKVREAVAAPLTIAGELISIRLSVGVSVYPDNGENIDELLRQADRSMFQTKAMNRLSASNRPARASQRYSGGAANTRWVEKAGGRSPS